MTEITVDDNGYVMATLPANTDKDVPTVGFLAHVDTATDFTGKNVNPQIIESYDGHDIVLNDKLNVVLSPEQFPELSRYKGQTLITTDGTTLLGADNKAGIAEIMTAMAYLIKHPDIKHGTIRVAFTPDEEIGRGLHKFDVGRFNAAFAYTIDGGPSANCNMKALTQPPQNLLVTEKASTRERRKTKWSTLQKSRWNFITRCRKKKRRNIRKGMKASIIYFP